MQAEPTNPGTQITAVRNEVRKGTGSTNQTADVGHSVKSGEAVTTGSQGLAEIKGAGDTTLRLGEKSRVSLDSDTQTVQVHEGTVLIQTSPSNGPVQVTAGGVQITVEEKKAEEGTKK